MVVPYLMHPTENQGNICVVNCLHNREAELISL